MKTTLKDAINIIAQEFTANNIIPTKTEFISRIYAAYPEHVGKSYNSYNFYFSKAGILFNTELTNSITVSTTKKKPISDFDIVSIKTEDITADDIRTYKTGTYFDNIASNFGGLMGKTQYEVSANAGVGKTTLLTQIGYYLLQNNDNMSMLFISDEMSQCDWKVEVHNNPTLSGLPVVFMADYVGEEYDYKAILEKALNSAKYVIIDSMSSIIKKLISISGMKPSQAQNWLRTKMIQISEDNASIMMGIKHMTTDGKTKGGTEDKHMFTGNISLIKETSKDRYVFFEKNRRGGDVQNKRLYYRKAKDGSIYFDENKFNEDEEFQEMLSVADDRKEQDNEDFNELFTNRIKANTELNVN